MNRNARADAAILDRIVASKREEVAALVPRRDALVRAAKRAPAVRSFAGALERGACVAVIGEFKRRSPSAGAIGEARDPGSMARAYAAGGAAALSVLTDAAYFGGSLEDLQAARAACDLPVLRKDFTADALQVYEARAAGADAVLLIVRMLDDARLGEYVSLAGALGMTALVEVHDASELERALAAGARVIGINNRDLGTFRTDLETTLRLAERVPRDCTLVAESGIRDAGDVVRLGAAGVDAVLVGETLMRSADSVALLRGMALAARAGRAGARGRA